MKVNINPVNGYPGEEITNITQGWLANPVLLFIVLIVILMYYTLFGKSSGVPVVGDGNGKFLQILLYESILNSSNYEFITLFLWF